MTGWELLANYHIDNPEFQLIDDEYFRKVGPDCYCDVCNTQERPLYFVHGTYGGSGVSFVIVCEKHRTCVNNPTELMRETRKHSLSVISPKIKSREGTSP